MRDDPARGRYVLVMRTFVLGVASLLVTAACHGDRGEPREHRAASVAPRGVEQLAAPIDVKTPPVDAMKTASGLVYKVLVTNAAGTQPSPGDTALLHYSGWRQRTGATFFSTRSRGQPIAIDLAHASPGFAEVIPLLHKGETAVMWVPASAAA